MEQHRPLRVALVVSSLRMGGAERVMSMLANYWNRNGQTVGLITLEHQDSDFFPVDMEIRRIVVDEAVPSLSNNRAVIRTTLRRIWGLRTALVDFRPDVIVSFGAVMNILVILASTYTGFPVVVSERSDPRHHRIGRIWVILRWLLYRRVSALVAQTHSVQSWAETVVDQKRVAVIPNPISIIAQARNSPEEGRSSGLTVVGIGRLSPEKGFDLLIRAFARLRGQFPDWSLTIFGEGPARNDLEVLVNHLYLEEVVRLPGKTCSPEVELQHASLFVLPSRFEGFPNALVEAMAAGIPVVAANCPSGPAEIIEHGVSGMLVPVDDESSLANAMEGLMSSPCERQRLGDGAAREVERFQIDRVMSLWEHVLHDAVGRPLRFT